MCLLFKTRRCFICHVVLLYHFSNSNLVCEEGAGLFAVRYYCDYIQRKFFLSCCRLSTTRRLRSIGMPFFCDFFTSVSVRNYSNRHAHLSRAVRSSILYLTIHCV